ncbi:uracil-DNA glycosylase family protein [Thermogemmatispora sp.]|uniref:uracil-DNA glycosylase family protein n=1 Tax=Thermogemmatispora sp. TaxID=1968838 RepID=UPI001D864B3B|nr:uracil-DNA glycosylase family protein [Thermogemmatispora sp.]MBX5448880.1 uracil-DNA glycosylase [Thermogemmatispora sp.]
MQQAPRGEREQQQARLLRLEELRRLQTALRACRRCQDRGYLTQALPVVNPVLHEGLLEGLMVIGQAPGLRSQQRGIPFGGPGGRVLQAWLERAGFPPGYLHQHVYLSSLTRCYPGPAPRGQGDRRPSPQELALCRPFLEAELRLLRPRVILLVGGMAIEAFWGKVRLEEVIGTARIEGKRRWLPLPHPSGVSRWLNTPQHREQLQRALALLADWRRELEL